MKFPGHSRGIHPAIECFTQVAYCNQKDFEELSKDLRAAYLLHGKQFSAESVRHATIYHEGVPLIVARESSEGLERVKG